MVKKHKVKHKMAARLLPVGSQKKFPHAGAKWAELYCPRWNQTIGLSGEFM